MTQYAAFLRGINVGKIRIKMADLKASFEEMELTNVKTFLQTGNVVFETKISPTALKSKIESTLTQQYQYEANVLLYRIDDLKDIIAAYPFQDDPQFHRYAAFISDEKARLQLLQEAENFDWNDEKIAPGKAVIYWQVQKGKTVDSVFGKITAKPFYKKILTTRNLNTLEKMIH